jgi:broad specificity phosphatase PhoE
MPAQASASSQPPAVQATQAAYPRRVSDLHCPATLLLARHDDADGDHSPVPSDDEGRLTETATEQVERLARSLRDRRVARVYSSTSTRAVEYGRLAAEVLGVDAQAVDGLRGGSGDQVLDRYREALQAIADQHRGETVLVLGHGGVLSSVLPRLPGAIHDDVADSGFPPWGAVVEVSVDGDGFVVRQGPGVDERSVV